MGARFFFPGCRTVLDIGGQDSKVIALSNEGKVLAFQMNDKCAAGTGRFLEIMAASLGYTLQEFALAAMGANDTAPVNSMCTVFAESEVISLKNHGTPPGDISRALHLSVIQRMLGMLHRIDTLQDIVFTGGVARNRAMVELLKDGLGREVLVPEHPEITGAVGAALTAELSERVQQGG